MFFTASPMTIIWNIAALLEFAVIDVPCIILYAFYCVKNMPKINLSAFFHRKSQLNLSLHCFDIEA